MACRTASLFWMLREQAASASAASTRENRVTIIIIPVGPFLDPGDCSTWNIKLRLSFSDLRPFVQVYDGRGGMLARIGCDVIGSAANRSSRSLGMWRNARRRV